jgi:ribosomal protein S18 acetylase RimI-like enzyme
MDFVIQSIQSLKDVSQLIHLHNKVWNNSTGIIDLLENATFCYLLMDKKAGKLAGYLFLEEDKEKSFGEINDIVVDPKYRNQGCGKMLLKEAMKQYKRIKLNVDATKKDVINFYLGSGFEQESMLENYYSIDRDGMRMVWSEKN